MTVHPLLAALGHSGASLAVEDGTDSRTWDALADRATRLARVWTGHFAVPVGGRTAVLSGNRCGVVEAMVGALVSGTWLVPINQHLTAGEIAGVLEDLDVRFLLTEDRLVDKATAATADLDIDVVSMDHALEGLLASASDTPFPLDGPPGGGMFTTSGTTGRPKGVRRAMSGTVAEQLESACAAGGVLGLDGGGPHLVTGPLYHAAPMGFALMDLYQGAAMIVMERFDAAEVLRLIDERAIRETHLVPTMFVRLLQLDAEVRATFDGSSLRTVLHGAAPIAPAVKQSMIDWWGETLVEYWGASEGGVVTLVGSADWLAHPGTVGRAVPTYEVFAGTEAGEPIPIGDVGVLWCHHLRHDRVFEYVDDPAKTAIAHPMPGTYSIGDIGRVDLEGWVYLADRAAHTIISGGVNIYPAEIEAVLGGHRCVADVAVFGIPDDEWGEQVKAAVELREGFEASPALEAEILAFARDHLARYKVPRSIDVVESLPRQDTGKLHVRQLRDPYWEGRDRAI